jgi:hypothetical protein
MDRSEVRAIVEAEIEPLLDRLGISHWRITVHFGPIEADHRVAAGHKVQGECLKNAPYDMATITLDPEEIHDPEHARKILRHELFHVLLAPFDVYRKFATAFIESKSSGDVQEDNLWEFASEQAVINLERMWRGLQTKGADTMPLDKSGSKERKKKS